MLQNSSEVSLNVSCLLFYLLNQEQKKKISNLQRCFQTLMVTLETQDSIVCLLPDHDHLQNSSSSWYMS